MGKCKKPENLKGEPKKCSPEQIKKCHGNEKGHSCVEPVSSKKKPEVL